jgi:hypothetical protein
MLHGGCQLKAADDHLSVYKKSARVAINSGAIFGYLDHPFSPRYQYGWESEQSRVNVHRDWIEYLNDFGNVLFESEESVLDHIRAKAGVGIRLEHGAVRVVAEVLSPRYPLAYEFEGSICRLA